MSNKEFVIKYYKDIKNACYKYYKITSYYIDFDDFFQDVLTLMLSNKAYDENLNVKPFTFICCVVMYSIYIVTYYYCFIVMSMLLCVLVCSLLILLVGCAAPLTLCQ